MLKWLVSLDGRAWSASFLNVAAMAFQLWTLITKWEAGGVSLAMLAIFCFVQYTYMQVGYKTKQWALFWGMLLSLLLTGADAALVVYLQHVNA